MSELEIRTRGNPVILLELGAMEYETCATRCVELTPEDCKQLLEMLNQRKPIKGSQQERTVMSYREKSEWPIYFWREFTNRPRFIRLFIRLLMGRSAWEELLKLRQVSIERIKDR